MKFITATSPAGRHGSPGNTRHDSFKARGMDPAIYPLTLYYDAACPLCRAEMTNLMLRNAAGHLRFVDVSASGFTALPGKATLAEVMSLMHGLTADGRVIRGVDVFRLAYAAVGLGWASRAMSLPVLGKLADRAYPVLARNRHRIPSLLVRLVFETSIRRAAEKAAASTRCTPEGNCRL